MGTPGPQKVNRYSLKCFSAQLARSISRRPKVVAAANVGAGVTFIAAGLSILALERRP